jgi:hypothetical protein
MFMGVIWLKMKDLLEVISPDKPLAELSIRFPLATTT